MDNVLYMGRIIVQTITSYCPQSLRKKLCHGSFPPYCCGILVIDIYGGLTVSLGKREATLLLYTTNITRPK